MPTPLEGQILNDFEDRLAASGEVPDGLARKLMTLARSDRAPTATVILEAIKENAGDGSE